MDGSWSHSYVQRVHFGKGWENKEHLFVPLGLLSYVCLLRTHHHHYLFIYLFIYLFKSEP